MTGRSGARLGACDGCGTLPSRRSRPRSRSVAAALAASLIVALGSGPAAAVETILWEAAHADDLPHGTPDAIMTGADGSLTLAPRLTPLTRAGAGVPASQLFWSLAVADSGTVYLGTGSDGRILRVTAAGAVEIAATLKEPYVTALAIAPSGDLIAATSPKGSVYRIGGRGEVTALFEPEERYIWSLAVDRNGVIFAGTGERGRIYRIDPRGDGEIFFDGDDPNVVSQTFDRQGRLLAGTDGRGLILRIEGSGQASVLFDSDGREITCLAVDGAGQVYAGAFAAREREPRQPGLRVRLGAAQPAETAMDTPLPTMDMEEGGRPDDRAAMTAVIEGTGEPFAPQPGQIRGTLLRLSTEGGIEEVWSSGTEDIYALAAAADGNVWFGTGVPAVLRRLTPTAGATAVARFPESQVTALGADRRGRVYLATSNAGAAYALGPESAERGVFTSRVLDGGLLSQWGMASWDSRVPRGARIEIQTRTGSSPIPDSTWSSWSASLPDPAGSAIASPPGRFLQWRAILTGGASGSPVLDRLRLASRPKNRPPRLGPVRVPEGLDPPPVSTARAVAGGAGDEPADTTGTRAEGDPAARPRWAIFDSSDPDGDPLTYRLSARPVDGGAGRAVDLGTRVETAPPLEWDDSTLPEGRWVLSVRVSDEQTNPESTDLEAVSESAPLIVDRTPPRLGPPGGLAGARGGFRIEASDALSPIRRAEYSQDGRRWRSAAAGDGIFDGLVEQIVVAGLDGTRSATLRVIDAAGNEARMEIPPATAGQ